MPPGPVIVPLSTFIKNNLTTLWDASTQSAFYTAFDAFVSADVSVIVNGKETSRAAYAQMLWQAREGAKSVKLRFEESNDVPTDPHEIEPTGAVAVFYKVTLSPSSDVITSSLNLLVEEVEDQGRKVTDINDVFGGPSSTD